MLAGVAIIPSAPLLVPDLVGAAADEDAELTAAALEAAARLPDSWLVLGAGAHDRVVPAGACGTFAGYGVDLPVRLAPGTPAAPPTTLPLCALIAGWVRGRVRPEAGAEVHVFGADPVAAHTAGRRLRGRIDSAGRPMGVLVVADGATTLTAGAPGGHRPADAADQRRLDAALAGGEPAALAGLPETIGGRAAFAALGGLADPPRCVTELYRGAPYGVGYFVGFWAP
ncbi:hypothetical protein ABQE69_07260 [Mycolicibacillus trivialis]|uniref:Uncharacterized protein n=1 Tax=Mycolicibacillus trivialis TaxID=1798 RepID=A0A1X2EG26_9MYCO|nr:hypothetical protein [Mycolicibacillus trivialis]ORX01055.1 hypothetical protein AWC30_14340 [Mycolicibacillus trivialis]